MATLQTPPANTPPQPIGWWLMDKSLLPLASELGIGPWRTHSLEMLHGVFVQEVSPDAWDEALVA